MNINLFRRPGFAAAAAVTVAVLAGYALAPAGASLLQDPAAEAQAVDEQEMGQKTRLEYQIVQLQATRSSTRDGLERARAVASDLETQLRNARLAGEDEPPQLIEELGTTKAIIADLEDELAVTEQQIHELQAQYASWEERYRRNREARERQQQLADIQQSTAKREEAQERADAVIAEARMIADAENAAEALRQAYGESEIQKLRTEYAAIQQQGERTRMLAERGLASAQEVIELTAKADMALAELRQAEIRRLLEQVEREEEAFAARAQAQKPATDPVGQEDVLQTAFFRGYLDTVQQYARLSSNPDAAAVAAVITAADLMRDGEPQVAIEYFEPMLADLLKQRDEIYKDTTNLPSSAVESAVRLQLAEAYNAAGQKARALEVLREIVLTNAAVSSRPSITNTDPLAPQQP